MALCEQIAVYAGFPRALNAPAVVDEALAEAGVPRPPPFRRVRLSDHETLVVQAGEAGPAVVLVHALGLDWRMWEPVMPRLAAGRRVLAYVQNRLSGFAAPTLVLAGELDASTTPGIMAGIADRIPGATYRELPDTPNMQSVPALAREAHASRGHFVRSFKKAFGETPHRYLLRRRVERAKELLRNTQLSVTEVSLAVGFYSLGSFSTAFRQLVGESPSAYARRLRRAVQPPIPACFTLIYTRPYTSTFREAGAGEAG